MSDRIARISFFLSLAFLIVLLAFTYGIFVGRGRIWPAGLLQTIDGYLRTAYISGEWRPLGTFVWAPVGAARDRIVIHKPDLFEPGYRAILGWGGKAYMVWLIDQHGRQVHSWTIDYQSLDPNAPSGESDEPHGMKILEDGSILLNFDRGDVLARIDVCGRPIWVQHGIFHHSIDRADDGTFWTWRADHSAYGPHQYLVNFDPATGKILQELSLIDDFIERNAQTRQIFALSAGYHYDKQDDQDLFHPNDIEVLHSDMAPKFPMFKPGDLLVSFRNIHLVAVLDPMTKTIKWASHGPWRFQHDPDFTPDGKILVYNNNTERGRSNIIAMDPASRQFDIAYANGNLQFYSGWAGKVQRLPGGALLVTVPEEGRVFEATWSGELIFEFNNVWSERVNAYVINAEWLPETFFDREPSCP